MVRHELPLSGPGDRRRHRLRRESGQSAAASYAKRASWASTTRPVLVGPVTFLLLAKARRCRVRAARPARRTSSTCMPTMFAPLAAAGVEWVQLDEPALVTDRTPAELDALPRAYTVWARSSSRPKIFVATYFATLGDALPVLAATRRSRRSAWTWSPGLATCSGSPAPAASRQDDRRWGGRRPQHVAHRPACGARRRLPRLIGLADQVAVSTSCSLLHVPVDAVRRDRARSRICASGWRSHGRRSTRSSAGPGAARRRHVATAAPLPAAPAASVRRQPYGAGSPRCGPPTGSAAAIRSGPAAQQARLRLPALPTTTIGSFPQTDELRKVRAGTGPVDSTRWLHRADAG